MRLAPNFELREFTATRIKAKNEPNPTQLENLRKLAQVLQQLRNHFGRSINITSGFRSPAVNKAVGGSTTSSHSQGLAADFHVNGLDDMLACEMIAKTDVKFDQLIYEQDGSTTWIHLGIGPKMRQQILSWKKGKGYVNGIIRF